VRSPRLASEDRVTFEHIIYIPAALLVGTIFGYTLGARAVRRELAQLKRRIKR